MSSVHTEAVAPRRAQQGFTLIELMIVVAVVAFLAAVAIPSYRSHVIKTNRSSAESFMQQVANKEEQVLLDMRNYVPVAAPGNFPSPPMTGLNMAVPADVLANYTVTVAASAPAATGAPPGYVITAVPNNPPQNDPLCQTLSLDNTGAKRCTGTGCPGGSPTVCWQ